MAQSYGKKDTGSGASKRPAQILEGTATEISVESSEDDAAQAKPEAGTDAEQSPGAVNEKTVDEGTGDGDTKDAAADLPPPPPRKRGATGWASHLAAGILGGIAGAAGLAFAWQALPPSETAVSAPDLANVESRIAKLEAAPPDSPGDNSVAALEKRLQALEERADAAPPAVSALEDRVAELETTLTDIAEASKEGGAAADAAVIGQHMAEAEKRLEGRIDAALVKEREATATAVAGLQRELAELGAKFAALAEAEFDTAEGPDLEELEAITSRISKLESLLPNLADAVHQEAAEAKSAAAAIAFANLRAAVSEGRPFATELDTLGALSPPGTDLGALTSYAEKGIPARAELARSFKRVKDEALAAPDPKADASFLDRLLAGAESLVKIRRVDAAAMGDDTSAVLARAEAKLDQGNLAEAAQEVDMLEGSARTAFSTWLDQARARLGAEAVLKRLEGVLLVSLGGGAATAPEPEAQRQQPE